jgi:hypothetical protein
MGTAIGLKTAAAAQGQPRASRPGDAARMLVVDVLQDDPGTPFAGSTTSSLDWLRAVNRGGALVVNVKTAGLLGAPRAQALGANAASTNTTDTAGATAADLTGVPRARGEVAATLRMDAKAITPGVKRKMRMGANAARLGAEWETESAAVRQADGGHLLFGRRVGYRVWAAFKHQKSLILGTATNNRVGLGYAAAFGTYSAGLEWAPEPTTDTSIGTADSATGPPVGGARSPWTAGDAVDSQRAAFAAAADTVGTSAAGDTRQGRAPIPPQRRSTDTAQSVEGACSW